MKLLKVFALAVIVSLCLAGCEYSLRSDSGIVKVKPRAELDPRNTVVVEGCEYFVIAAHGSFTYVHKGNCKNPIHPENR